MGWHAQLTFLSNLSMSPAHHYVSPEVDFPKSCPLLALLGSVPVHAFKAMFEHCFLRLSETFL